MAEYYLTPVGVCRRADGLHFGVENQESPYFLEYKAWLDAGNVPDQYRDFGIARLEFMEGLKQLVNTLILGGFYSSASGTRYHYDSALEDQLNLSSLNDLGEDAQVKCMDEFGAVEWRPHTAAQIHKVYQDYTRMKLSALRQYTAMKNQAEKATRPEELPTLAWVGIDDLTPKAQGD